MIIQVVGLRVSKSIIYMINIYIKQLIQAEPKAVLDILLDHENLDRFLNAKFKVIKFQNDGEFDGGVGCVRQVTMGGNQFNEEIIKASLDHICYRIVGKGPVTDHQGDIRLIPKENNKFTVIKYCIRCNGPIWLPSFLLKWFISSDIKK